MPIAGTKVEITKADMATVIQTNPDKVWRPQQTTIGPLPNDQKYAVVAIALAAGVAESDHAALVTALEGIAGVQRIVISAWGISPAAADIPAGTDAKLKVRTGIQFDPTP